MSALFGCEFSLIAFSQKFKYQEDVLLKLVHDGWKLKIPGKEWVHVGKNGQPALIEFLNTEPLDIPKELSQELERIWDDTIANKYDYKQVDNSLQLLFHFAAEVYNNYYDEPVSGVVTMLDVLGWKGVYNRLEKPIESLMEIVSLLNNVIKEPIDNVKKHEIIALSDTILIISYFDNIDVVKSKHKEAVLELHGKLCAKAISLGIRKGIPLRGATSVGNFECKENTFVGVTIDEVASWHENAEWIGCIMTPSAYNHSWDLEKMAYWINYKPIPLKSGKITEDTKCVDWTKEFYGGYEGLIRSLNLLKPITPDISVKLANTIAFFRDQKGLGTKKTDK